MPPPTHADSPTPHATPPSGEPIRGPHLGLAPGDRMVHKGERVDLILRQVKTNSGKSITREVCLHIGAVIILPITDRGEIVLIKNRRHTVFDELLELPAGTLERHPSPPEWPLHEDPAQSAARELAEETGYQAREITPFGWFYTSPGILTEKMYAFIARGLSRGEQDLEDNEQIQVALFTPEQVLTLIRENKIVDAKTIATLLKYLMNERRPGVAGEVPG